MGDRFIRKVTSFSAVVLLGFLTVACSSSVAEGDLLSAPSPAVTSGTRRVTQFYDPSKGSFPVDGRYALSSQPSLGNRIVDGITETTTFVAPQPAAKMGQFRRLMTGVGTRKNYVEFDVFPGELVSPSGTKRLLSPFQQTVSGQVDLIGRNATYGVKGTNYLDYGFRYSVGAGAVGGGGYLTYDWLYGDE